MRLSVFSDQGDLIGTNDYYSIGGGFVINGSLATSPTSSKPDSEADVKVDLDEGFSVSLQHPSHPANHPSDLSENIFYKSINRGDAELDRRAGSEVGTVSSSRATVGGHHSLTEPVHRIGSGGGDYESEAMRRTLPTAAGEFKDEHGFLASRILEGDSEHSSNDEYRATIGAHSSHENHYSHAASESGALESDSKAQQPEKSESKAKSKSNPDPHPPYPFYNASSLLYLCKKHNLTIAQLVYENERHWYSHEEITDKIFKIWGVMDTCIVSTFSS